MYNGLQKAKDLLQKKQDKSMLLQANNLKRYNDFVKTELWRADLKPLLQSIVDTVVKSKSIVLSMIFFWHIPQARLASKLISLIEGRAAEYERLLQMIEKENLND